MAKTPTICAGDLNRTIRIQAVTETQSNTGDTVQAWATIASVRAQVVFERGTEQTEGPGEQARAQQRFRIRWRTGITNKHRISYTPPYNSAEEQLYDIMAIQELGRRQGLEIQARARVE